MSWVIDQAHTSVEFSAKHMMFTTVRGRFNEFSGTINIDDNNLTQSTAAWTIAATSVDTRDPKRDAHLRSADFFDVEQYPTITFRSTGITHLGENRYKVTGDLTIRDVTKSVDFEVAEEGQGKSPWGTNVRAFSAQGTINRKDFGLNWNVALETGGWLVGDQIKINVDGELVEQALAPANREATKAMV